jgi:hypothetical protein
VRAVVDHAIHGRGADACVAGNFFDREPMGHLMCS